MSSSKNYYFANRSHNDVIPDFLVDSVPFLHTTDQISQLSKDSMDPYFYPAKNLRKLSSSSAQNEEANQSTTSTDKSRFSFEINSEQLQPLKDMLASSPYQNKEHELKHAASTSQLSLHPQSSNQDSFSFHTAHSDGDASQHSAVSYKNVNIQPYRPPDIHSEKTSPKLQLKIQTSTPSKSPIVGAVDVNESSREFSFFNTSGFQPDSPSSIVKSSSTTPVEITHVHKSSPHSRNSSVSWQVNNPEEWTVERIGIWLDINGFNQSWINTFKKHGVYGQSFLNLTSYQNLQKFKSDLDTSNDSTQSRFIHLLRKTLDRATSITTINAFSPNMNSDRSSFEFAQNSDQHTFNSDPSQITEPLAPTLSASVIDDHIYSGLHRQPSMTQVRLNKGQTKRRPVSTFEGSTKSNWNQSSPVSPAVTYGFFRRQHNKSSSSESSIFTSIFSSSSSHLPQPQDEKRQSILKDGPTTNEINKGLLSKFRKKHEKSRDRDIISPTSPNSVTSHAPRSSSGSLDQALLKRNTDPISESITPFFIDRKFQPSPNSSNSDKFILATADNLSFKSINIGQCTDRETFRKLLIDNIIPGASDVHIHLTDFGCSTGEPLDNEVLDNIIKGKFSAGTGKYLISLPETLSTLSSSTFTSTSDLQSFESKDDKTYPNTPQHYYEANGEKSPPVDYLNFKDHQRSSISPQPLVLPIKPEKAKSFTPLTNPSSSSSSSSSVNDLSKLSKPTKKLKAPVINQSKALPKKSSLVRKPPPLITTTAPPPEKSGTFRVIRKQDKSEINFDKRRESPYSNKAPESFIAGRDAPPPPPLKRPNTTNARIATATAPTLDPVKESLSNEGTYMGPYAPGSSNTLVPVPYKGGGSVSPISRKAFELRNSEDLSRSNTSRKSSISRSYSTRGGQDKFKENIISFDDAPSLDDESDDSDDDGFWAKAPSSIGSNSTTMSEMVVRPVPEVLYENMEKFFPNTDLDEPVIDISTPPTSPLPGKEKTSKIKRVVSSSIDKDLEKLNKPQRMKTIRAVVREARNRENSQSSSQHLIRRQSTKMWGRKVVEVKPNQKQYISKLRKDKNDDDIKEFSWIKGELIGKGTFGNVYIALNVTTGEMIAVKQVTIPSRGLENQKVSDVIDALRSEVDTLKDLEHVNVVQYLGFEKTEKEYNLFLEYVAGGSVASCLKMHGRFEEPLIKFLTSQVVSGLAYLHSKGILHRDMKADNLLLDPDGVCKISDFGISKKSNDIYANNSAMSMQGTIFWMAPEVVYSSGTGYSAKVDIWSLGCVVLEMFAGRRPWSNLEAIPAMIKIGKSKAAPPIPDDTLPYVSDEGRHFLDSCFTTDPNKRPTAQELSINVFSKPDKSFVFAKTRLAAKIRENEKRVMVN